MAHICFNLLSQKLHLPLGWWSFFSVNPNPGEAKNLPKSARQSAIPTADKKRQINFGQKSVRMYRPSD
jgi:hypothetical protein